MSNRPMRRVTLRIGLPEERGPRVLPGFRGPDGTPVNVSDPKIGPSGFRAVVEPDGEAWKVTFTTPEGKTGSIPCASLRGARDVAKDIRQNGGPTG